MLLITIIVTRVQDPVESRKIASNLIYQRANTVLRRPKNDNTGSKTDNII